MNSLYFLGIGGTLMGSLAQLASEMGFAVSGSDNGIYPPMSDQLAAADIEVFEGPDKKVAVANHRRAVISTNPDA